HACEQLVALPHGSGFENLGAPAASSPRNRLPQGLVVFHDEHALWLREHHHPPPRVRKLPRPDPSSDEDPSSLPPQEVLHSGGSGNGALLAACEKRSLPSRT